MIVKSIPNLFPYMAREDGKIINLYTGRILKTYLSGKTPREKVKLSKINHKGFYVSVLICSAFYGERPSIEYECHHKDGNGLNNITSNLEWIHKETHKNLHKIQTTTRKHKYLRKIWYK